jgi:general secretion pathway protein G
VKKRKKRKDDGFTFIEIMVAMIILLTLIGAAGFAYMRYISRARVTAAKNQIQTFELALNAYYLDCEQYPTTEQGLNSLWTKPVLEPVPSGWAGPYLTKEVPVDPWKKPYEYRNPGPNNLPFGIRSFGADGLQGGEGNDKDITSWEN